MRSTLKFRNVEASPDDPLEDWPFEGILAALERGGLPDWRRLARAIAEQPWGDVTHQVEEALTLSHPYGVTELMQSVIASARAEAVRSERAEVAAEIADILARSGLTQAELAWRIGTSASRLSTYVSGHVVPSAALMVRLRRVVAALSHPG